MSAGTFGATEATIHPTVASALPPMKNHRRPVQVNKMLSVAQLCDTEKVAQASNKHETD